MAHGVLLGPVGSLFSDGVIDRLAASDCDTGWIGWVGVGVYSLCLGSRVVGVDAGFCLSGAARCPRALCALTAEVGAGEGTHALVDTLQPFHGRAGIMRIDRHRSGANGARRQEKCRQPHHMRVHDNVPTSA